MSKPMHEYTYKLIIRLEECGFRKRVNDSDFYSSESTTILIVHDKSRGYDIGVYADKLDSWDKAKKCSIILPLPKNEVQRHELMVYLNLIGKSPTESEGFINEYFSKDWVTGV